MKKTLLFIPFILSIIFFGCGKNDDYRMWILQQEYDKLVIDMDKLGDEIEYHYAEALKLRGGRKLVYLETEVYPRQKRWEEMRERENELIKLLGITAKNEKGVSYSFFSIQSA